MPGLSLQVNEFPRDQATCTLHFEVAAGPWKTVATSEGSPGATGRRDGPNTIFGEAIATRAGTALAVSHDITDLAVRLVAVDRDGKEHPSIRGSGSGVKDFRQLVAEFDAAPEQIREYRLQSRPYERAEIQGIALRPRQAGE